MAAVKAIREAVAATLNTIDGLKAYDTVPESVIVPAVLVSVAASDFLLAFGRGTDRWDFDLTVLVSSADWGVAQNQLDEFVNGAGAKSIRQKVFQVREFGLTDGTNGHVAGVTDYGGAFKIGEINYVGATLQLVVHTPGTA